MEIAIRNYLSGSFLLEQEPNAWDAIVILDPVASHTAFVGEHTRRHLYLRFDDVELDTRGKRSPTTHDVRSALDFASKSQKLLVCCRAGQSRSAATAFVISYELLGPDAARSLLDPKRHAPNSMIIELGSRLTTNSLLKETFDGWCSENRSVKLRDHLDAIEREFEELERRGARNRIVAQMSAE